MVSEQAKQVFILLTALIPESFIETMLVPLNPFVVKHILKLHGSENPENVGRWVGVLGSSFYLPLFIMNAYWGHFSDSQGRKPVLILGLYACALGILIFGMSTSVVLCIFARIFAGFFGANSTVTKSMLGELAPSEKDRSWAYAMYGAVFGVAGILGPALGGLLARDSDKIDSSFSSTYPFALAAMFCAALAIVGLILVMYFLKETRVHGQSVLNLHQSPEYQSPESEIIQEPANELYEPDGELYGVPKASIRPIALYCTMAGISMLYITGLPLFFAAPVAKNGLEMNAQTSSSIISVISITKLVIQLTLFKPVLARFGILGSFQFAMLCYGISNFLLCFINHQTSYLWLGLVLVLMGAGEVFGYLSVIILITNSSSSSKLGLVHGVSATAAAVVRTITPTFSGFLWQWSINLESPQQWILFIVTTLASVFGLVASRVFTKNSSTFN